MKAEILTTDDLRYVSEILNSDCFVTHENNSNDYKILRRGSFICEIFSDVKIEHSRNLIEKVKSNCSDLEINSEQKYNCLIKIYELEEPDDWPKLNDSLGYVSDKLKGQLEQFIKRFENPVFYFDNVDGCDLTRNYMCELNKKVIENN
jgi:hypothetical protein